jgi:hypothetical protein
VRPLSRRGLSERTSSLRLGVAGPLLAAGAGGAVALGYGVLVLAGLAVIALCALAVSRRGVLVSLLLLAAMNGVPFLNAAGNAPGKFSLQDVAGILLAVAAAYWLLADSSRHSPSPLGRHLSTIAWLLLAWWILTVFASSSFHDVPILKAVIFGRDFGLFAVLLILLPRVHLGTRDLLEMCVVLAVGAAVYAVGQIAATTGLAEPGSLIHYASTFEQSGLTRLYSNMTDLVELGLCLSVAALFSAQSAHLRRISAPASGLFLASIAVQLTRARWIGIVVGLVLATTWYASANAGQTATALRKRLGLFCLVGVAGLIGAVVIDPSVFAGGTFLARLSSIFGDIQSGSGTVASRQEAARLSLSLLGEHWLTGLGFVPPAIRYFSGLPGGSLRDSDLGLLNAVVTMGVIGAVLVYLPVLMTLRECLRSGRSAHSDPAYAWLRYGSAVWLIATLVSSITLITLFSLSGLAMTAVLLSVLAQPEVVGGRVQEPAPRSVNPYPERSSDLATIIDP